MKRSLQNEEKEWRKEQGSTVNALADDQTYLFVYNCNCFSLQPNISICL